MNSEMMRALIIKKFGSEDVIELTEMRKPYPKADEVLVKVHYAGINPLDVKIRKGKLTSVNHSSLPLILGADISGEVVKVGESVKNFKVGDEVFAMLNYYGGYAEFVSVSEKILCLKPEGVNHQESATIPLASLTALQALRDKGLIRKNKKVLVNGASGGVGIFAVQLSRIMECSVTAVCSANNFDLVHELGALALIDYQERDFIKEKDSYDIIFDVVGNRSFEECKDILTSQGIYVTTKPGFKVSMQSAVSTILPIKKAEEIVVKPNSRDLDNIRKLVEEKKLKTVVNRVYSIADIAKAHKQIETGHTWGKLVLSFGIEDS